MRSFQNLILRAHKAIVSSDNHKDFQLLSSQVVQKLMSELGYNDSPSFTTEKDKNNK